MSESEKDIFASWVIDFYNKNKRMPKSTEVKRINGSPFDRSTIYKMFGPYNMLIKELNLGDVHKEHSYDDISDEYLLQELRAKVFELRSTDRDLLRKNGLKDRSVYERRFGSWSKALACANIGNCEKTIMKYFDDYVGENYIEYLKNKIGTNGDFTVDQYDIINKAIALGGSQSSIRNSINYSYLKRNFISVSILQVACGLTPTINYCTGNTYIADDGHICDSGKEVEIDNFLHNNNIKHEVHVNYPNSDFVCDFKIDDIYVEYAGLMDKKKYRNQISKKEEYIKANNINSLIIYNTNSDTLNKLKAALSSDV